ncbi:MAG: GntR family transcriptional regulator [Planctomycetes bacterium]|nr:GntR family transcriptional regulator [Planctomycetota bacterium]
MNEHERPNGKRNGLPKYQRVREAVRRRILDGTYAAGTRLPPDTEFHKELKVNKLTAVRALNELAREGLIVRRQGSGSYVADAKRPPLFPGRHLKLGVLLPRGADGALMQGAFFGEVLQGIVRRWGVQGSPEVDLGDGRAATRAVWHEPARGVTVTCLGEAENRRVDRPPFGDVRDAAFDGLIALAVTDEPFLARVAKLGAPLVLIDHLCEALGEATDQVYVDPIFGYGAAVRHFLAQGLKRVHFVGLRRWAPAASEETTLDEWKRTRRMGSIDPDSFLRLNACRQAMDAAGLALPDARAHFEERTAGSAEKMAAKLLALPAHERPQAVLCHEMEQADRLIEAFAGGGLPLQGAGSGRKAGLWRALPITLDAPTLGAVAAELLLDRLREPNRPYVNVGVKLRFAGAESGANPEPMAAASYAANSRGETR